MTKKSTLPHKMNKNVITQFITSQDWDDDQEALEDVCKYWMMNACKFGSDCFNQHCQEEEHIEVLEEILKGYSKKDEKQLLKHFNMIKNRDDSSKSQQNSESDESSHSYKHKGIKSESDSDNNESNDCDSSDQERKANISQLSCSSRSTPDWFYMGAQADLFDDDDPIWDAYGDKHFMKYY